MFDGFRPDAAGNLVLHYPAESAARIVGEEGYYEWGINDRGQVALQGPTGVARWMDGRLALLVTPRTIIADGVRPLAGGICCRSDALASRGYQLVRARRRGAGA
ncbi:MAG: hypothetical protein U0802_11860 [Candidatus Binatia bacterium]